MASDARSSRFIPWVMVLLVLLPAGLAWRLQRDARQRDSDRFEALVAEVSPRFFQHISLAQALAGQVQRRAEKADPDWGNFHPETDWHLRLPHCQGYGFARLVDGKLAVEHETLRSRASRPGRDLLRYPEVATAWRECLLTGQLATTQPFATQEDMNRQLVLMIRPLPGLAAGAAPGTGGPFGTIGMAYSLIDPDTLFDHAMRSADRRFLAVERLDWQAPSEKSGLVRTLVVSASGFGWKFRVTPGPEFFAPTDHRMPYLVLGGGLLVAGGIFWFHRQTERRRRELEDINRGLDARVETLTASLARENEQLRAAEARTARALEKERELGELKGRVVSTVSHEFRTPLSIILSSAEILRVYHDRLDEAQRAGHLVSIEDSVRRMNSLIQGVLAFGKAGAGRLGFTPEAVKPTELLPQIVGECLSATSRRCPISLEMRDIEATAWLDPVLLRLVLGNLLGNAVKYSPAASPVTLTAWREGDQLALRIEDRGIGIPAADLDGLFEAFHRASNTHGIPGTGLGLSIARSCAERHGGTISVASVEGAGTTFTVFLPAFTEPPVNSPSTAIPFPHAP